MELKLDLSKEYSIVLEGGGAKGAYQVGVWKALREAGIKIKAISGASVGSLNGALMCMDDLEKAEYIWENITYSNVLDIDEDILKSMENRDYKSINLQDVVNTAKKVLLEGGFDITPLRRLIDQTVDEDRIRASDRELYIVTYSVSDKKKITVNMKEVPEGSMGDMLLASAYFMAFKNEKLGGKRYMDGGGVDNVPMSILLEQGYKDIIVIRIYGIGFDSEKVTKIPDDVKIYHIAPRQDLGGILEFDKKKSRKNMKLGYFDAKRFLYGLVGRIYYIDAPNTEPYYFDKMMSELELLKQYLNLNLDLNLEVLGELEGYRVYTETVFPRLAVTFRLKEDWSYKDIYIAILEEVAKSLRLNRFCIYTVDELLYQIHKKMKTRIA